MNATDIIRMVETIAGIPKGSIVSRDRTDNIALCRKISGYLMFRSGMVEEVIGRELGGRDHSTANYYKKYISERKNLNYVKPLLMKCIDEYNKKSEIVIDEPISIKDIEYLQFIHDRLIHVHGESESTDYLIFSRDAIRKIKKIVNTDKKNDI
jgi:hypothetical protein